MNEYKTKKELIERLQMQLDAHRKLHNKAVNRGAINIAKNLDVFCNSYEKQIKMLEQEMENEQNNRSNQTR